jgi:hypothetical protein
MKLGSFIGKAVLIDIPAMSEQAPQWFTLDDVEPAGLWLRSDAVAERVPVTRTTDGAPDGAIAPDAAIFVPFSQIRFFFGTASRTQPTEEEVDRLRAAAAPTRKAAPRSRARKPIPPSRRSRDAELCRSPAGAARRG